MKNDQKSQKSVKIIKKILHFRKKWTIFNLRKRLRDIQVIQKGMNDDGIHERHLRRMWCKCCYGQ